MNYYRFFVALAAVSMIGLAGCGLFDSQMERELARKGFGIMEPENQRLYYRWFGDGWSFQHQFSPFSFIGSTRSSSDGRLIVGEYSGGLWSTSQHTPQGLPPSGARRPMAPLRERSWDDDHRPGLVVLDLSGREIWRVERFPGKFYWLGTPVLSPDHEKIAIDSESSEYYILMRSYDVIEIPGSQRQRSAAGALEFRSIDWAPDSRRIVFELKGKLLIYDIETRRTRAVTDGSDPAWSPDGKWIAYRTADNIGMMVSPETGERRTLFNARKIVGPIRWSPDSEYLMYNIRHEGFANKVESLWNLADTNYRVIVHRRRDGAEIDARSAAPIGILDSHNWVKR